MVRQNIIRDGEKLLTSWWPGRREDTQNESERERERERERE
jgi:hypothetical protein